ncbi:MAG: hypothetical protein QOG53_1682 [Frankiales bacterium]|nr:hypothetical protein [Frankiales bacterium]
MPANKELHFFNNNFNRGAQWLRGQFAAAEPMHVVGEMTPDYFEHAMTAERMATVIPGAKVVVILRHPVERAYSHYQMQRARFSAEEPFAELVDIELTSGARAVPQPHRPYLRGGKYFEHLQRLLDHYPRSSVLVLLMDDLETDPATTYRQLCAHIGVASDPLPENLGRRYNRTMPVRSRLVRKIMMRSKLDRLPGYTGLLLDSFNRDKGGYAPLDASMRQRLLDYYRDDTTALANWLGRDLSSWLK